MNKITKTLVVMVSAIVIFGSMQPVDAVCLSGLINCSNGSCLINAQNCSNGNCDTNSVKNANTESNKNCKIVTCAKKNTKKKTAAIKNLKKKSTKKNTKKQSSEKSSTSKKTVKKTTTTNKSISTASGSEESEYVQQVALLVNKERASAGLSQVTLDETLTKAAMTRAKETVTSFSHTRPNGTSFSTVLSEHNISYRGAGENIAWGQKSPEEVMNGWMNSAGHRANILNANYKKIGVGYYKDASGRKYWSQLFIY